MNFRTNKLIAPIAKRMAGVMIAVCTCLVIFNAIAVAYFHPQTVVNREIAALAEEYYEDYLYHNLVGGRTGDEIAKELEKYHTAGVNTTYLRQLLLYDSGRRNGASTYFDHDGYTCNRNETYVKFYPDPPYGYKDYHFDVKLVCE